jgi:hypothetical protein
MFKQLFKSTNYSNLALSKFKGTSWTNNNFFLFSNLNEDIEDPIQEASTKKVFQGMMLNEAELTPPKVV